MNDGVKLLLNAGGRLLEPHSPQQADCTALAPTGPATGHRARPGCEIDDLDLPRAALNTLVLAHREPA
jgi:hypothetical protein